MAKLLYEALSCEFALAYVHRLLAAFPIDHSEDASKLQAQTNEFNWVEPLSKRELEIHQLITEWLMNHEISVRLYLSPDTVKTHTINIQQNGSQKPHPGGSQSQDHGFFEGHLIYSSKNIPQKNEK